MLRVFCAVVILWSSQYDELSRPIGASLSRNTIYNASGGHHVTQWLMIGLVTHGELNEVMNKININAQCNGVI